MNKEVHSDLNRADILELLDIASGVQNDSLERLLTKFCKFNDSVRFASLWRVNIRSGTISIYARSQSDYRPQLGRNGENIQEFLCPLSCESVSEIINSDAFLDWKRRNISIRESGKYGIFHPKDIVEYYNLDKFVVVPIKADHSPRKDYQRPRFFCLLYCPLEIEASSVADLDIEILQSCIGNMIYNRFNELRWSMIQNFTEFLSTHHDPDTSRFLNKLQECIPCDAVFQISRSFDGIILNRSTEADISLSKSFARELWDHLVTGGASLVTGRLGTMLRSANIYSALSYQTLNHDDINRVQIVFCNKISKSPLRTTGAKTFRDHFGFDDELLVEAVGEHVRAFTDTLAERRRRDNVTRIIAHEIKQPLIDIRNSLARFRYNARHFGLDLTMERIEDATDLAILLAEMNTDFTPEKIVKAARDKSSFYMVITQLSKMKKSLRGLCEDFNFKNDSINFTVQGLYRNMRMSRSLLATIFINTVSNSIKYSLGDFDDSWCSIKIFVVNESDMIWDQLEVPRRLRERGLLVTTTDNGRGIPQGKEEEVFQKERRLDHPEYVPGLGLGLFHLRSVVEAIGGSVWLVSPNSRVRSDKGYSTRVFTLLPEALVELS